MRTIIESLSFRALVLATLVIAATLFAVHQPVNGELAKVEQPHADQQARNVETEKTVLGVGAEGWTAIFTMVLAVFTMGLAGVTYWLFSVTKNGIAEQGDLTRQSLDHAATSAIASARQAESAVAANRAHVRIIDFRCPINVDAFVNAISTAEDGFSGSLDCQWSLKIHGCFRRFAK